DPEQHAIVTHDGGPLLVVAGPGAGKTRVLTHAIAHRIGNGLPPQNCLAVTFTRRARDELRDRLTALLGAETAAVVTVATFHGLGLLILREQAKLIGLDGDLKVADEKTRRQVLGLLSARERPSALGARIGSAKRVVASPSRHAIPADGEPAPDVGPAAPDAELADLVARYDAALRERGMVDLDDLVTLPTALLAGDPSLAAVYRSRWTDVFVDEYQDVDEQQYLLLRQLAAPGSRTCAIGDPDQAIYGFRGGDVGYFLRFQEDFSGVEPATPVEVPAGATAPDASVAAAPAPAVTASPGPSAVGNSLASEAVAMTVRLSRSYRSA